MAAPLHFFIHQPLECCSPSVDLTASRAQSSSQPQTLPSS